MLMKVYNWRQAHRLRVKIRVRVRVKVRVDIAHFEFKMRAILIWEPPVGQVRVRVRSPVGQVQVFSSSSFFTRKISYGKLKIKAK